MNEAELVERALDELLSGWDTFVSDVLISPEGTGARAGRHRTEAQMCIVMGLVTHVHETARVLRPFMPEGLTIVHMPLVRSIYESTLTAVWCDEVADGAEAIMKEDGRQRRALQQALAGIDSLQSSAPIPYQEWADVETPSADQARRFEKMAGEVDLDGAYAYYRVLSSLSHVSIMTIDEYVEDVDRAGAKSIEFIARPEPVGGSSWSYLVAYCLIWAGTVANYYDKTRMRRNELRRIARELGIRSELGIHVEAVQRGARRRR